MGILVVAGIMTASAYAVTSVSDENHLMYGPHDGVDVIDNLWYDIPSNSFTSYSSNKNGFAINHPEKWIIEENYECQQEEPCMFSLIDNSYYWSVEVNVNFMKNVFEDYSYSSDEQYLKDFTDISNDECINSLEYYGTQCSNYELIYAKAITVSGIKAYEIHYAWTETYSDRIYENFITTITEIPQGNDLWYIYSETLEEYSDHNSKLIEKTLDSFSIKKSYN